MNNSTIDYYNKNAEAYFASSKDVDLNQLRNRFAAHLPAGASIIDVGCGSGRDVRAFIDMGFDAIGLDASASLASMAEKEYGIQVIIDNLATWKADIPFDAVWSCASLLHLSDQGIQSFFDNLRYNLKPNGMLMVSVKNGIDTGFDENNRFFRNFTFSEIESLLDSANCTIVESNTSEDVLGRDGFKWLNVIAKKAD